MSTSLDFNKRDKDLPPLDLNGDGIPDGAEINMAREIMQPDGGRTKITAKWQKGQAAPAGMTPPAAAPQAAATPAQKVDPWKVFDERNDRQGDRMGIGRTNTDERPVAFEDRAYALSRKAGDLSISPVAREAAARELTMLTEMRERQSDRDLALKQGKLNVDAQQAKNQREINVAEIMGGSRVQAAQVRGEADVNKTAIQSEFRASEGDKNREVKRDEIKSREQIAKDNRSEYARRWQTVNSAKDNLAKHKEILSILDTKIKGDPEKPGTGKTLRQYIEETYNMQTGKLRPGAVPDPVYDENIPFLNEQYMAMAGHPFIGPAPAKPAAPEAGSSMDKYRRQKPQQ
jgi:hypothetical protein